MKHLIIIAILLFAATVYSDEQQSQYDECYYNYNAFLAGPYRNAANKREIEMKCGKPHHIPGRQLYLSGDGQTIITGYEEWYYYFEDDMLIFTFNNKGKLIKKDWKRD